jgi:23S rRNA pseudouridine2605 synthase
MRSRRNASAESPGVRRVGVARVLSKLGLCSRTQAAAWVAAGRVRVNGRVVRDPEAPVRDGEDRVEVDGQRVANAARIVVMLNKPRGLVTTASDERGRDTVYSCLDDPSLPWLAPVGRLDKASEGLLLFTNDPAWAALVTSPASGPTKTYHVQIDRLPDAALLAALTRGVTTDGEPLRARSATCLRSGAKHAWLEVVLDEGRNRQIRRLLAALDVAVLRLVRVAIGPLQLGTLPKGRWRRLVAAEVDALVAGLAPLGGAPPERRR